ncbi:MAG: hypothetical protein ACE5HS_06130 [bacterium]
MIFAVLMILVAGFVAELVLPWWSIALVALVVGWWRSQSGWRAFWAGFVGIGLLWLATAGYFHFSSGGILTTRVGEMFHISIPVLLLFISAVIGGLVGGLAAMTGYQLRAALK